MNISNIVKRGNVYHYKRRVPEHLHRAFKANGHDPGKIIQLSLKTKDASIALARKALVDAWVEGGGLGLIDFIQPREHYLRQLAIYDQMEDIILPRMVGNPFTDNPDDYREHPTDTINQGRPPLQAPDIQEALESVDITESELTAEQYAALIVEFGRDIPNQYKYSLRDALRDFTIRKSGEIQDKTLKAYDRAVALFLGRRPDIALDSIDSGEVALWIDSLIKTTAHATRVDHVARLMKLFKFARVRKECFDRRNPFEDHDLGKPDKKSIDMMLDSELLSILDNLKSDSDRAWAILARHSGMRLAELAYAEIVTVEGVVCFDVKELAEGEWSPKTDSSKRLVPIRKSLIPLAKKFQPKLKRPKDYTKRFGNVKAKLYPNRSRELVFHSLRKTFVTEAQRAGYHTEQVAHVVGHAADKGHSMTGGVYMKGHKVKFLSEIVEAVKPLEGYD